MTEPCDEEFRFGIEAEYMLVDAETFRPLWHHDLTFHDVHEPLAEIAVDDLPSLEGLQLEPPHRKLMPYVVEGYHVPDPDFNPIDLLPKGVEIRTPVACSIGECLSLLQILHGRMQDALVKVGMRAVALSHHPLYYRFEGPQNKRRYDFWRWATEVMTTYGPDINISLPRELGERIEVSDLHAKCDYYGPALAALTMASPFRGGELWHIRGRVGKSMRTHRRSVFGQLLEIHPEENGRLEFKPFEMTPRLDDFAAYFLLWLALLLDDGLKGRASYQSRIYDLGCIARDGLAVESVIPRAAEVLDRAPQVLASYGFDPLALRGFQDRLDRRRLPADDLIELYEAEGSIEGVLRHLSDLVPCGALPEEPLASSVGPAGRAP